MNDQHVAYDLLQRYADGDLSPPGATDVAQHLQACTNCSKAHNGLLALHNVIGLAAEESTRGVDFDALYSRIDRGIRDSQSPGFLERLSVWWRDLIETRPERFWVPMTAGTLAALALVIVATREATPKPKEIVAAHEVPALPVAEEALALATTGSEVVQVDFGDGTGTVYEIAMADGTSTPVVWINDEEP